MMFGFPSKEASRLGGQVRGIDEMSIPKLMVTAVFDR